MKFRSAKRLTKIISAVLICFFTFYMYGFTAYAASNIDFALTEKSTDNNRLFTINMQAKSNEKISAALFYFTYDKDMFEFRSMKCSDDESEIEYNETDKGVKAVFLNSDGKRISDGDTLFTLTFKSVSSGSSSIDFTVSDCVNSNTEYMNIGKCTSADITVNSKSNEDNYENDENDIEDNGNSKSDKSRSSSKNSSKSNVKESTATAEINDLGELSSIASPNSQLLIIGIAIGCGSAVTAAVFFVALNHIIKKKKEKDKKQE